MEKFVTSQIILTPSQHCGIPYLSPDSDNHHEAFTRVLADYNLLLDGHPARVYFYSSILADKIPISYEEKEKIAASAYLHDIGKVFVRESILNKNGFLDPEERISIRRHPQDSIIPLYYFGFENDIVKMVLLHHERIDGKGYPLGLKGKEIPLGARIIAITDTFDCLTSWRPYRSPLPGEKALQELVRCSGTQFDSFLVSLFVELIENYQKFD